MRIDKLEQLDRTLGNLIMCLNLCATAEGGTAEWFISFGTLLGMIRDRKNVGDIDISMFFNQGAANHLKSSMCQFNFQLSRQIIDPATKQPYYMSFEPVDKQMNGDNHVDIFLWYEVDGIYYHTYDHMMEQPESGIPSEYVFKGIPGSILRGATWHESWPDLKHHVVRLPQHYGACLDYWYPGWLRKDSMFGQSKTKQLVRVKHPQDLRNPEIVAPQIERSTKVYEEFKNGYRGISCL